MGFLAANRIGIYKADQDVDVTFEGDNTVSREGGFVERGQEKKEEKKKKLTSKNIPSSSSSSSSSFLFS